MTNLIKIYAPLVKRIAYHLITRLPADTQIEDLLQIGMIALIEASKNFDETKGASFETYASIRIRGMMLDEVRKNNWIPRSVYENIRKVSEAMRLIEMRLGRDAKDHEVAEQLNLPLVDYYAILKEMNTAHLYGFDEVGLNDDSMKENEVSSLSNPFDKLKKEKFYKTLLQAVDQLPERERLILSLYYDKELNLKEIGAVLDISESRVSQIHSQSMMRLRKKLQNWDE